MTEMDEAKLLMLVGAPRSGTSWIAKILDSHPDVLYLHEPDTVLRSSELATICSRSIVHSQAHIASTRQYVRNLLNVRTLKSSGSLPIFKKKYRSEAAYWLRVAVIFALRAADAAGLGHWARRLPIPDLISRSHHPLIVLKSVSSRGRLALFGQAMPSSRMAFILRHPCGQVASTLAGIKRGKFERRIPFEEVLVCDEASELGLTPEGFRQLPSVQQAAWHWAILNQKALNDLTSIGQPLIVRYEDVCSAPVEESRRILAFAGLEWTPQTEKFLQSSTSAIGPQDYYGVVRNSAKAAEKWRTELSSTDQAAIMEIVARVPVGKYYLETQSHISPSVELQ